MDGYSGSEYETEIKISNLSLSNFMQTSGSQSAFLQLASDEPHQVPIHLSLSHVSIHNMSQPHQANLIDLSGIDSTIDHLTIANSGSLSGPSHYLFIFGQDTNVAPIKTRISNLYFENVFVARNIFAIMSESQFLQDVVISDVTIRGGGSDEGLLYLESPVLEAELTRWNISDFSLTQLGNPSRP